MSNLFFSWSAIMEAILKTSLIFLSLLVLGLSGCAQLQRGQLQPVKLVDPKNGVYETTCSGAVEDWGSCYNKAKSTCPKGFDSLNKSEKPDAGGVSRQFMFQCK